MPSNAMYLEDRSVFDAAQALRATEEALRQALERGASDEEIEQLTDQLRVALDKLMQALAEQVRKNPSHSSKQLLSSRTLRARYDGISARTIPRWIEGGVLPPPDVIINGRHFWWEETIERHERTAVTARIARKTLARHERTAVAAKIAPKASTSA
jgi:hypothetical protein